MPRTTDSTLCVLRVSSDADQDRHYTFNDPAVARCELAEIIRAWRACVRIGSALRVERHHGRDDMPSHFVVDWDGRVESVQLERI